MNKDSWTALIIASVITILAATPLFYSRDFAREPKDKISGDSDTKMTEPMTEPMKRTKGNTEPTIPMVDATE